MNLKNVWKICLFLLIGIGICSCSDDDPLEQKVVIKLVATPAIEDAFEPTKAEGMEVTFTNMRDMNTIKGLLNKNGEAQVELYRGIYNISIESKTTNAEEVEVIYSAKLENCAVNSDGQEVKVNLNIFPANTNHADTDDFSMIFAELFFNGETNSGQMMHPDQYMVLFNPTQNDLYVDGLSFATAIQYSVLEKEPFFDEYMPAKIPITGFFTIPGNGKEHLVKAGEKIVIAWTAIDHSSVAGYDNAVNLSGADFEVYIPNPENPDVDNPEVPNVTLTDNVIFFPRGFFSNMLFKLENGNTSTIEAFYNENISEYTAPDGSKQHILSVDADKIIDGVLTGDRPIVTRNLPEAVDRGFILVSGCHRNELVIRKEIKVGAQIFYQDTNNSEDDFVIRIGQTPYPKGWRTNN